MASAPRARLGSFGYDNDFRRPVVLAKEAATLDLLRACRGAPGGVLALTRDTTPANRQSVPGRELTSSESRSYRPPIILVDITLTAELPARAGRGGGMAARVTVCDATATGTQLGERALDLLAERVTLRELIRSRVYQEVREYNAARALRPGRLFAPAPVERALHGEPIEDAELVSGHGIFLYLSTHTVQFLRVAPPMPDDQRARQQRRRTARRELLEAWTSGQPTASAAPLLPARALLHGMLLAPIPLDAVPPIVFSEVMRDVDLFVGVCSVGADPRWPETAPARYADYWSRFAFGALATQAETRRAVLARLLPRLPIADRCQLADRFLMVRGALRTYRIHLGSAGVLMEPNSQYLCIVPARGHELPGAPGHLYLPFDDDQTLALILSKAFLLTNDAAIKDPRSAARSRRGKGTGAWIRPPDLGLHHGG